MPYAQMVAEQVSMQWVMEARRASVAEGVVIQPTDRVETGSGASVIPPPTKPNVVPSEGEQPLSSSIEPLADAAGQSQ